MRNEETSVRPSHRWRIFLRMPINAAPPYSVQEEPRDFSASIHYVLRYFFNLFTRRFDNSFNAL